MSNWQTTNDVLAKLFNLPRLTKRAVIVLRGDGPPSIRVTRLLLDKDDVRQVTERFELRKVGAGETAPCHVCGWKDGYHDKRCSGYLVDPETGEPIPTHNV